MGSDITNIYSVGLIAALPDALERPSLRQHFNVQALRVCSSVEENVATLQRPWDSDRATKKNALCLVVFLCETLASWKAPWDASP